MGRIHLHGGNSIGCSLYLGTSTAPRMKLAIKVPVLEVVREVADGRLD